MSLILGIDLETTGLDYNNDSIVEIAAILWDTNNNKYIEGKSQLIKPKNFKGISSQVSKINGITTEMIEKYGETPEHVFGMLNIMARNAEAIVAHNGTGFDKPFLFHELVKAGFEKHEFTKPWIDTKIDLPLPSTIKGRSLVHMAAEHGFLNLIGHRAFTDVLTMLKIFSMYNYDEIVRRSQAKTLKVIALVPYEQREKAKNFGFRWNPGEKVWAKSMKDFEFEKERVGYDFQVNTFDA